MKNSLIFLFFLPLFGFTQEAVHNFGELQIHGDAMIGFHTNLINDGILDQDNGLVGFYSELGSLRISGSYAPNFFDAELAVEKGLVLDTPIGIRNNGNLITGDIITPRSGAMIYSNFQDASFYTGESNTSKINGYAAMTNKENFIFPVGDETRLRMLEIESAGVNPMVKCAYFYEDPNNPKSLSNLFSTDKRATTYMSVSTKEFWRLEGNIPSRVTLSWDEWSNIQTLGDYVSDLKVVGWSKAELQWVNLGNTAVSGDLVAGTISSDFFNPADYEILTLGGNDDSLESYHTIELDNYFMTPNGDGKNDLLRFEGISGSPNNSIQIFNRYGTLVYKKDNYQNEFNGMANVNLVINRNSGLETGIYFYIITFHDLRQKHQGYLYISK